MKLLITGHNGFVGQNLLKFFSDADIKVVSRHIQQVSTRYSMSIVWEELSAEDLNGVDAVIHLAGKAHDLAKTSNPEEYEKVNTDLTKILFDLYLQSTARDFFYFSSVKAVADKVEGELKETVTPSPATPYGQSKLKAEEYLLGRELPEGKRLFIFRPCMIHGPGNKGNLNLLYKFVQKRIPYPLAAYHNKRSFLSIQNLCFIIKSFVVNEALPGGTFNVADDEPLSTTEVIRVIGKASNIKPHLWNLPTGVINKIALVGDKLHLPLNSERLKKLTENYIVDNSKVKISLGISALPVTSREGLFKTIESFNEL